MELLLQKRIHNYSQVVRLIKQFGRGMRDMQNQRQKCQPKVCFYLLVIAFCFILDANLYLSYTTDDNYIIFADKADSVGLLVRIEWIFI